MPAHSHHYEHVRDALQAGKHVLCEKAITVNAAQAKALCELALKQKRLLVRHRVHAGTDYDKVEGCWTRYFPISQHIQRLLHEEKAIGEILQINAEVRACSRTMLSCDALPGLRPVHAAEGVEADRSGARWRSPSRSRVRPRHPKSAD